MTDGPIVLDFGLPCPKCLCPVATPRWCAGCDDWLEADHLHMQCVGCGFRRLNRCADTRQPPPSPPPSSQVPP